MNTISVERVSKKFAKKVQSSMLYGIQDIAHDLLGLPTRSGSLRRDEFWALKEVCLELKQGETMGIVGPNGSGKSTLLKILNGIIRPDKGRVRVRGRVGALIEVGAGFHPMLTGRENIYVNGAILGMNKVEIRRKFDSIVEFAEIGEFLDVPVKHYSSGMYVRLGFAVAAHCDPEILLVDEVLSVGDIGFQSKCFRYFEEEVLGKGVTLILVSHNIHSIARMCSRGLLLNKGHAEYTGGVVGLTRRFLELMQKREGAARSLETDWSLRPGGAEMRLEGLYLCNGSGKEVNRLKSGDAVEARLEIWANRDFDYLPGITLKIVDHANTVMAVLQFPLELRRRTSVSKGRNIFICKLHSINLVPGNYLFHVKIGGGADLLQDYVLNAASVELFGDEEFYLATDGAGLVYLPAEWSHQP